MDMGALASAFETPTEQNYYVRLNNDDFSSKKFKEYRQATHCMLYSKSYTRAFCEQPATILMHLRFDGHIGFPGGFVSDREDVLQAINRRLREEMKFDTSKYPIEYEHHMISHLERRTKLCIHFFAREIEAKDLREIEERCFNAPDYGNEVLGTFRVPLYTMINGIDGFPAFLNHCFIGISREQLLFSLEKLEIMSSGEIAQAVAASAKVFEKKKVTM